MTRVAGTMAEGTAFRRRQEGGWLVEREVEPHSNPAQRRIAPVGPQIPNEEVAAAFDEMAELLSIRGENAFRIRAYQRAAQVIRTLPQALSELRGAKAFDELPGIGPDLAGKIEEILKTGRLRVLEQLRRQVPQGLRELLQLPTLGPVRVRALNAQLGVQDIDDLRKVLESGRLERVRGFGPVLRSRLQKALATRKPATPKRWLWSAAAGYANALREYLLSVDGIEKVEIAGSYRRGRDTVGDLDVVIGGRAGIDLTGALHRYGEIRQLNAAGPTLCTAILRNGLQADLRLVRQRSFGSALHYFTGSREHNIRLRRRAQERGLKLNEYGLFRGRDRIAGNTEESIFAALDLPWIPPELRENRGEIEAAERHELPKLIELGDLRGDLHVHTDASDGRESLATMVAAARARGLGYIAITDHSRYLGMVRGLDPARLAHQMETIDAFNAAHPDFTVLKGTEVDILEDGRLALPDDVLGRLDVVVMAIHSHFNLSEAKQTARVLRAMEHPYVSILAHPTGRLLGEREPYALDFAKVLAAARARPCYVELNAQPTRLDADEVLVKSARDHGVLVSIASDAHAGAELGNLAHGVRQARRGWLAAKDVLNTRSLREVRQLLGRTRLG
jgi:DNA polymerase (family 10)